MQKDLVLCTLLLAADNTDMCASDFKFFNDTLQYL